MEPEQGLFRDALLDDVLAIIAHMRWHKRIVMGDSGAGPVIISFAVNFPDQLTKLVIVDSQMNRDEDATTGPTVGNPPMVFESVEAAMARFARLNNPPRMGLDRDRAQ